MGHIPRAEVDVHRVILTRSPNQPRVTKNQAIVINPEIPLLSQLGHLYHSFGWCPFKVLGTFPAKGF